MPNVTLNLSLIDSNLGDLSAEVEYMNVRVDAPENACCVQLRWEGGQESVRVIGNASDFPGIYSGHQLIGMVLTKLYAEFTDSHEFLHDVFYDADDNERVLEIQVEVA